MDPPHRKKPGSHGSPSPIDEENFPDNPTRQSADRHMREATNVPGSTGLPDALGKKKPREPHVGDHDVERVE